jgi:hypothetical protein
MRSPLIVLILLATLSLLAGCRPVRPPPALGVTLSKPDDTARLSWEGDLAVVEIVSPSGIGSVQLDWEAETPAAPLLLRLHLKGLEGLEVSNGVRRAAVSVDNAPPYVARMEGETQEIEVRRGSGVFLVSLHHPWLQAGGLEVRWVDFYR